MKSRILLIVLAVVLILGGCRRGTTPAATPSPALTMRPSASPALSPSADPAVSPGMSPEMSPSTSGSPAAGIIPGFTEGNVVDKEQVPEIVQAVKAKYPNAEITSITHSTYMEKQTYLVMISGAADGVKELHVTADGAILEDGAATSPKP